MAPMLEQSPFGDPIAEGVHEKWIDDCPYVCLA